MTGPGRQRVAVVGRGIAGAALALQPAGRRLLERLGLLAAVQARGRRITTVRTETAGGRRVLELCNEEALPGGYSLGVHRATVMTALLDAMASSRSCAAPSAIWRRAPAGGWICATTAVAGTVPSTSRSWPRVPPGWRAGPGCRCSGAPAAAGAACGRSCPIPKGASPPRCTRSSGVPGGWSRSGPSARRRASRATAAGSASWSPSTATSCGKTRRAGAAGRSASARRSPRRSRPCPPTWPVELTAQHDRILRRIHRGRVVALGECRLDRQLPDRSAAFTAPLRATLGRAGRGRCRRAGARRRSGEPRARRR